MMFLDQAIIFHEMTAFFEIYARVKLREFFGLWCLERHRSHKTYQVTRFGIFGTTKNLSNRIYSRYLPVIVMKVKVIWDQDFYIKHWWIV